MKLTVTSYEREQFEVARQIIGELNANLAGRGAGFRFAVTLAGANSPVADFVVVTDAPGDA